MVVLCICPVCLFIWYGGLVAKLCPTLVTQWTVAASLLCPWDSPGKNSGAGCHFLLHYMVYNFQNLARLLLSLENVLRRVAGGAGPFLIK